MELEAGAILAGLPDPVDIGRRVTRGGRLVIRLDEARDMPAATAAAQALRVALQPDVHVIASPGTTGRGPTLTVLRLVTEAEAAALRPALDHLVAEFRQTAGALVAQLRAESQMGDVDECCPETVLVRDVIWHLDPHGEHCRFENPASGEVVEADINAPDTVDPYFLLLYAKTSGRHGAVLDACVEGFHDMCRLLDLAGSQGDGASHQLLPW
ncbi:hypothetical protein [Catellatospora paridis]|uniref:hypothetical protein n=1 Tax=Catellatospora paridis TaxID=1617086 RepID=UPI0012D4BF98|nr:hypothetical protein [Catellatospora paridis]